MSSKSRGPRLSLWFPRQCLRRKPSPQRKALQPPDLDPLAEVREVRPFLRELAAHFKSNPIPPNHNAVIEKSGVLGPAALIHALASTASDSERLPLFLARLAAITVDIQCSTGYSFKAEESALADLNSRLGFRFPESCVTPPATKPGVCTAVGSLSYLFV